MMYGGSDAAADLGPPSGRPQGPGDDLCLSGLERRRRRRLQRALVPRLGARRAPLCAARPGGVLRLPGQPADDPLRRGRRARDLLADASRSSRPASSARRATSCSCRASSRRCAGARSARISSTSPRRSGVQLVVSLGALLGDLPAHPPGGDHRARLRSRARRSAPVLQPSTYEGPTGIVGVLHSACAQAGLPAASLWACVPHYAAAATSPKAALALVRRVERPDRRVGRRLRARGRVGGLRAPGRARGAERPGDPGVRRTPRAGGRKRAARARSRTCRQETCWRANSSASCASGASSSAPTARRPGRRGGSHSRRTPSARAPARSAARGCPRRPRARCP